MIANKLTYSAEHQLIVCEACGTCLVPDGHDGRWETHLRREPHRLKGHQLKLTLDGLAEYELRGREELKLQRPSRRQPCDMIQGLASCSGYICACDKATCDFATTRLQSMHDHMPKHRRTASQHTSKSPLWESCTLQTYFTAKQLIDYFVVVKPESRGQDADLVRAGPPPSEDERRMLEGLRKDMWQANRDLDAKAAVVEGPGQGRAERERWLVHTGFPVHLQGLSDDEIRSSFRLPKTTPSLPPKWPSKKTEVSGKPRSGKQEADNGGDDEEDLRHILAATDKWLRKAYGLVSDSSMERKMTYQRAQKLSDFAAGEGKKGKDVAFRNFKNEATLGTYFRRMKELLVYYHRVVYQEDGHFSRESEAQKVPRDVIEPTDRQRQAMDDIHVALREQDRAKASGVSCDDDGYVGEHEHDLRLESAIREFFVALICHNVGSMHFRSPVLSFCAMLSRTKLFSGGERGKDRDKNLRKGFGNDEADETAKRRKGLGCWHDPGNYSSHLSALIWTAQLILFESVCFHAADDEDKIPAALEKICRDFMHQKGETTLGFILQWRLYITTVARSSVTRRQARWSLDGQEVVYLGISLRMGDVTKLIASEYKRARALLSNTLLFGAQGIGTIEAWRLQDDLDADDYGGSWLTDERNTDALRGTQDALLRQIEGRADLRRLFVREHRKGEQKGIKDHRAPEEPALCPRAMAAYEADVQDFLKSLAALLFIAPLTPMRAPEFLSVTIANSGPRRRSFLIWQNMLMMHVRYRKTLEQTGKDGDNVRFIPDGIAELLLTFLAVVQPLRLLFLRQTAPGSLLSPYLFSKLDGSVWGDDKVSQCLSRACSRSEVPEFKVAWWRQVAASITKEKFTKAERANFDMAEFDKPEDIVDDEELLVDLAEGSNHSFRTFNHAYAGSTTLTMNTVMHRAHRASLSWRTLFQVDEVLAREMASASSSAKRPCSDVESGMIGACKRARFRTRPAATEADILTAARNLYNDPGLQLRRPGQREAMLAVMGDRAVTDQIVVVLATGSGKTLIAMVAAALEGAGTTVVVLPTVALRVNMIDRYREVGIETRVWVPGESKTARLVIVSAEAACTMSFLDYLRRLECQQKLDRVVIDECHLTVTASYRKSMVQLGSFVRQIRTQTVWLTATLPPSFEEGFLRRNFLVRPRMVRESTNRANIQYSIQRYEGTGGLCRRTVELVRAILGDNGESGPNGYTGSRDCEARMIIYCPTIPVLCELAQELECCMYTGDHDMMSSEEKETALMQWLSSTGSPIIVATSALGVGFDHPHVRWVIHAGAPRRMTEFSQESGRAGRDGKQAASVVLLSAAWERRPPANADEESMQLYLSAKHCLRAVMSQFLDQPSDWRWCMEKEDELCGVCPNHHEYQRPPGLPLGFQDTMAVGGCESQEHQTELRPEFDDESLVFTGPTEVLGRANADEGRMSRFKGALETMRDQCLLCRVQGSPFDHRAAACSKRWPWINAKKRVIHLCKDEKKPWIAKYLACFFCYLPQSICRRADPEAEKEEGGMEGGCRFRDIVMPLCYGAFFNPSSRGMLKKHFPLTFRNVDSYMRWLGEPSELASTDCIQAIRVAEMLLDQMGIMGNWKE